MNPQLSFILCKADETILLAFIRDVIGIVMFKIPIPGEADSFFMEESNELNGTGYLFIENAILAEAMGKSNNRITGMIRAEWFWDDNYFLPSIAYSRNPYHRDLPDIICGRLYVNVSRCKPIYHDRTKDTYKLIKKWILHNSMHKIGNNQYMQYFLPEAWRIIKSKGWSDSDLLNVW